MPDELGSSQTFGSQNAQAWQVEDDVQKGFRLGHASQPKWGISSANQPGLSQGVTLGAPINGTSALPRSIPPDEWIMSMPMDFTSNPSDITYNTYHSSSGLQQHTGVDLDPGNGYTTTHTAPIVPQEASLLSGAHQTQWPSSVQRATATAPTRSKANSDSSYNILPEPSHNRLDLTGSMQHSDRNIWIERKDIRPSSRR